MNLAFGPYVRYGQIIKVLTAEGAEASKKSLKGDVPLDEICTSHIERHNLTVRTFMRRCTRRTIGYSRKLANLKAATAMNVCHFNYCWRPNALEGITPAMATGLLSKLWSVQDLYENVRESSPEFW